MKEVTLHLLGSDLSSTKYDGFKLDKIHLTIATTIGERQQIEDIIETLQILKYTLDDKCKYCGK